MAIFGKNREEDFDEELEERVNRIPSKKFKDLKPENKKRRKEPVKPWGRRERIFILSTLAGTIFLSGVLALTARNFKLPGLPRLAIPELPRLGWNFFEGETIVIGQKKQEGENMKKIDEAFKEKTKNLSGVYALYVIRLSDGSTYGVNENEVMQAASLIKLPTFTTLYMEAEKGKLDLDKKYTLKNSDKRTGSGSLAGKPAGTVFTYRELAELMGKQSDNTAFNIIRSLLGDKKIEEVTHEIGMGDTSLKENETAPRDIGTFFQKLWQADFVSKKDRDEILEYLTDTIYEDWIPTGIPDDVRVAHKYGRELHVVNDAGIVFSKEPFVLVLMTEGVIEKEANKIIPELAKIVYDASLSP